MCTEAPVACPDIFDPVWGCDGITYGNSCDANAAGVSILSQGQCRELGLPSRGVLRKSEGDCDGFGTCLTTPVVCSGVFDPVCGCDGVTYTNSCFAQAAGVNVDHPGECDKPCRDNGVCDEGEYCAKNAGDFDGEGTCQPTPAACTRVFDTVCGCDGVTYDNECLANQAGVNVARRGTCQSGCESNTDCPGGEFCLKATGDCDGLGSCEPLPPACTEQFDPVCGCDGVTYTNECHAWMAGVSVASEGPCPSGCTTNGDCAVGEFCRTPDGDCNGQGTCETAPVVCTQQFVPVCGCDGRTYINECEARKAGVSIASEGECTPGTCTSNGDCPLGDFCHKAEGDCNGVGTCTIAPIVCPAVFDPVCGCDGVTYSNACEANLAGVSIARSTACTNSCSSNDD